MSEMTRKEAIRIIERRSTIPDAEASWLDIMQAFDMAIEALKEQRPHGEWIEHRQYYMNYFVSEYECSNCHDDVWQKTEWQFCPNCGASMRPETENVEE